MKVLIAIAFSILLIGQSSAQLAAQHRPGQRGRALDQLGLTHGQKEKLIGTLRSNRMEAQQVRRALMEEREQFRVRCDQYQLDAARAREIMTKVNRLQLAMLKVSLDRQLRLRSVLNPDQLAQLNRIEGAEQGRGLHGKAGPQLGLSADQRDAIGKLWKSQSKGMDEAHRSMSTDLAAIDRAYNGYRLDERAARHLISRINQAQLRHMQVRLEWQIEMRKILSEEQFRTLTQHVKRSFGQPSRRWGGPGRQH